MKNEQKKNTRNPYIIVVIAAAMAIFALCWSFFAKPAAQPADGIGIHHAEIVVRDYGTIKVELDGNTAPISVENFINLAKEGFYDGLTFHRIIKGFMIQGGDPSKNGTGGSGQQIIGEFALNGYENNISHVRGTLSMARSKSYNSASSQFFIVHEDSTYLDGQYAAFGHVIEGMEVVDAICEQAKPVDSNGTMMVDRQPIITSITILD